MGAGKSTVGRLLAARGALVIDTDEVAREVLAPGTPGERAVLELFGPSVAHEDGSLDRRALASRVFASASDRLALEAITHPLIRKEVNACLAVLEAGAGAANPRGDARAVASGPTGHAGARRRPAMVVIEIPLLDRSRRREYDLDTVVLVEAPNDIALQRATRRGIPKDEAIARMAAQPTTAERRAAADRVITNAGSLQELEAQIDHVLWLWLLQKVTPCDDPAT